MRHARRGIVALENMDTDAAGGGEVDTVLAEHGEEGADATLASAAEEAGADDNEVAVGAIAADGLSDVGETLVAQAAEGGVTEETMAAVSPAVEALMRCAGYGDAAIRAVGRKVSKEGFRSSKGSRASYGMEAGKTLKERASEIWASIMAAIKRAVDKVLSWWDYLFEKSGKTKRRAEALKGAAEKLKGKTAADKVTGDFATALELSSGRAGDGFVGHYKTFTDEMKKVSKMFADSSSIDERTKLVKAILEKAGTNGFEAAVVGYTTSFPLNASSNTKVKPPEGMSLQEWSLPLGGKSVFLNGFKSGDSYETVSKHIGDLRVYVADNGAEFKSPGGVDAISPEKAIEVCDAVIAQMKTYEGFRKTIDSVKKIQSELKDAGNKLVKEASDEQKEGLAEHVKVAMAVVGSTTSFASTGLIAVKNYDSQISTAALDYVGASLKGVKSDKTDDKK